MGSSCRVAVFFCRCFVGIPRRAHKYLPTRRAGANTAHVPPAPQGASGGRDLLVAAHRKATAVLEQKLAREQAKLAVRAHPGGRLSALRVSHRKSVLCGAFVWQGRALNGHSRRNLKFTGLTQNLGQLKRLL
jgi:hypothetical protein